MSVGAPHRTSVRMVSDYLRKAFGDLDDLAQEVEEWMEGVEYDTLVGTGLSGALVVPHVARFLNKHWLIVRKEDENAHSFNQAEGELGQRWVFLDDLIDSGDTADHVRDVVEQIGGSLQTVYVGTCLYHGGFRGHGFLPAS